jgi:hypothetical protein
MKNFIFTPLLCVLASANVSYAMYPMYYPVISPAQMALHESHLYFMEQKRQERERQYPLHVAAENGDMERIISLVNGDHSLIHLRDGQGETALHKAARCGLLRTTRLLLRAQAQQTLNNYNEGPFELAIKHGHGLVAELLTNHWYDSVFVVK